MPIGVVIGPLSATPLRLIDVERLRRERRPGGLHDVDPRVPDVPGELDAGRLEHPARGLGQLGAGPVAGNECHRVRHGERIVTLGSPARRYRPSDRGHGRRGSAMTEFNPGLEGVVAFETEIAEPDRDGGALRYRGVDIEELVGSVPFEKRLGPARRRGARARPASVRGLPCRGPDGRAPADLQAVTARLGGEWQLRQADRHLGRRRRRRTSRRLSATMISVCAQSARLADGHADRVDPATSSRRARRPPSGSCSNGAARPIRSTSRRSTRTGSARPSTGSTPRRSPRGSSPRPGPTAQRRSPPRSGRSRARSTAARRTRAADARRRGGGRRPSRHT